MPTVTPDLSEFEALSRSAPGRCKVGRLIEGFEGQERVNLEGALVTARFSHRTIERWLRDHGAACGREAIQKHRNQDCCCDRPA